MKIRAKPKSDLENKTSQDLKTFKVIYDLLRVLPNGLDSKKQADKGTFPRKIL